MAGPTRQILHVRCVRLEWNARYCLPNHCGHDARNRRASALQHPTSLSLALATDEASMEPGMDPVGVAVQSGDGPRVLMPVPRPGRRPGLPQEGKLPHMRLDLTDAFGNACSLRYDHVDHAFIAYCGKHKDARCTATRTLNAGKRPGSGRPLGFVVAWLLCGGITPRRSSTKEWRRRPRSCDELLAIT